jgi:hypothetical protein
MCNRDHHKKKPSAPLLNTLFDLADGPALRPDSPRSGLSALVAHTVHACAESVRVPIFLQELLAKLARLTREPTCNGSRPPPLYRRATADCTPTIDTINSTYHFYLMH